MQKHYFYLAVFISIATTPATVLAEMAADPVTTAQSRHWVHAANDDGLYIDLPRANHNQLMVRIRTYLASLTHREEEITKYLDENQLDAKDALITAIMPGGLVYAAVRKASLEQANAELAEISEDMDELSRDLLAMQAESRVLTVAHLGSDTVLKVKPD
jgi:hypothetical protein